MHAPLAAQRRTQRGAGGIAVQRRVPALAAQCGRLWAQALRSGSPRSPLPIRPFHSFPSRLPQIPRWVYSSPSNLASEEEAAAAARASRKEHVGPVQELQLVLRLSPSASSSEQDVALRASSSDTVRDLKEALHTKLTSGDCDQAGGPAGGGSSRPNKWRGVGLPTKRQRLFYRGKELQADHFLQELNVESGAVIQVFLMAT